MERGVPQREVQPKIASPEKRATQRICKRKSDACQKDEIA
jgi:hypothetical protein